ncbi:MAG: YceD family protein [Pseudomonadota bacterium]
MDLRSVDRRSIVGAIERRRESLVVLEGAVNADAMPRICDAAETPPAEVCYTVRFSLDDHNRVLVSGSCQVNIALACASCLDAVDRSVEAQFELRLLTELELERLDRDQRETLDVRLVEPAQMDVVALLEDELLLALPIGPCPIKDCARRPGLSYGPLDEGVLNGTVRPGSHSSKVPAESAGGTAVAADRQRPFAQLKELLGETKKDLEE